MPCSGSYLMRVLCMRWNLQTSTAYDALSQGIRARPHHRRRTCHDVSPAWQSGFGSGICALPEAAICRACMDRILVMLVAAPVVASMMEHWALALDAIALLFIVIASCLVLRGPRQCTLQTSIAAAATAALGIGERTGFLSAD